MSPREFVVRAQIGAVGLWRAGSELDEVALSDLELSGRLVVAFEDWASFFDEIEGDLSDPEVAHEFVSQGFKIAHRLRAEMKGSTVHLVHPVTGEHHEIVRQAPR